MTSAGWYPDPAGQPNTYRYWNGQSWSQETRVSPAPPPPPPGGGSGKVVALVVAAVVLLAALGTGAFFGMRALTDDDGGAASDDTSGSAEPTEPETDATEGTTSPTEDETTDGGTDVGPTGAQCNGGSPDPGRLRASAPTLSGGDLMIPSLSDRGYTVEASISEAFTFADDYQASYKVIESTGESWIANYGVGGLAKVNGFGSPQQAAEVVLACMTSSDMYKGYSGKTDLEVGPVRVDGHDAYSILTEVRVDNPDVTAEGDVTHVVVVDTGDPDGYGLYISVVPIGDQAEINQQARVFAQIDVQ